MLILALPQALMREEFQAQNCEKKYEQQVEDRETWPTLGSLGHVGQAPGVQAELPLLQTRPEVLPLSCLRQLPPGEITVVNCFEADTLV